MAQYLIKYIYIYILYGTTDRLEENKRHMKEVIKVGHVMKLTIQHVEISQNQFVALSMDYQWTWSNLPGKVLLPQFSELYSSGENKRPALLHSLNKWTPFSHYEWIFGVFFLWHWMSGSVFRKYAHVEETRNTLLTRVSW